MSRHRQDDSGWLRAIVEYRLTGGLQSRFSVVVAARVVVSVEVGGIFSSRKLQRACQENLAFKYLAGMETQSFRTFIEFRQRHREDMKAVFVQTVQLARALGLARLSAVALDGSKVEANTSKHKAMSYGRMLKEEKRLKQEIDQLLETAEAADEQDMRQETE